MAHHFRKAERRQKALLPADRMEWLPENDIVHLIVEAVELMDLSMFEASSKLGRAGQAPFASQVLLALLIYAYSQGVRSSRAIERLCQRDADYRFIVAEHQPDHTVIARFRRRHAAAMKALFLAVLRLCREAGLVRLGLVALDGTKVQGNASLDANRTAASLEAEIETILAEAAATDAKEDSQPTAQQGAALPKALARLRQCQDKLQRRAAAAAARQQAKIDARQAEEQATGKRKRGRKPKPADPSIDPATNACITDPESGIMTTRRGWLQGYNAQIVVTTGQIIIATDVTTDANDLQQLQPMLGQAQANAAAVADKDDNDTVVLGAVVADAGYWSEANAASGTADCELIIAT